MFINILKSIEGVRFPFGEIIEKTENWSEKMQNLRAIVKKVESYFENKLGKGIKTNDINLVNIAHSSKEEEIKKLFEIVLALLMEAPNK